MKGKLTLSCLLVLCLLIPATFAEARGFSGGFHSSISSHSSFGSRSSSSRSSSKSFFSGSSSRKSTSSSKSFFGGSSKKTTSAKSKVSLNKSKSFSEKSSTKSYTSKSKTTKTFFGATSTKASKPVVTGRTYTSRPTSTYYHGHHITITHYYHTSFWHPFSYYHGFTSGMFWGSMMHPWGSVYPVQGHYVSYGPSPVAWVIDAILLIILLVVIIVIIRACLPSRKVYSRRF